MIGGYYLRIFIVCRVLKLLLEQAIMEGGNECKPFFQNINLKLY